jgi:YcaO-like protein with predicted kinase domain
MLSASLRGLSDAVKHYRKGTDRTIDPEETIRRATPFFEKIGISRIATLTGLDRIGIPVVAVCRPNSRSISVSQGKGVTLHAAIASGVMEAIENYHAERIQVPLLYGSYSELVSHYPLMDVSRLARLSTAGDCVTERRLWIEGRHLLDGGQRFVPYEIVSTDYRLPLPPGSGAFPMTSNGLASGNHLLEAISHGLCELVERDSSTLWHVSSASERARSRIDLETVEDSVCRHTLLQFAAADVDVLVFETTSDVGIPAFRCEIADREGLSFRTAPVVAGYGCHPRAEVALSRAMTEAAQGRLTLISGSRDDIHQRWYDETRIALELESFRRARDSSEPMLAMTTCEERPGYSLENDVEWELERLAEMGFDQPVVVDLTNERIGIPVCRVVVPGLEAFNEMPGFVPGARARTRSRVALS